MALGNRLVLLICILGGNFALWHDWLILEHFSVIGYKVLHLDPAEDYKCNEIWKICQTSEATDIN